MHSGGRGPNCEAVGCVLTKAKLIINFGHRKASVSRKECYVEEWSPRSVESCREFWAGRRAVWLLSAAGRGRFASRHHRPVGLTSGNGSGKASCRARITSARIRVNRGRNFHQHDEQGGTTPPSLVQNIPCSDGTVWADCFNTRI